MVKLIGGGSVINGAYPIQFHKTLPKFRNICYTANEIDHIIYPLDYLSTRLLKH